MRDSTEEPEGNDRRKEVDAIHPKMLVFTSFKNHGL